MKDKLAFVCQRYGLEVNGGAELHCRQLAEKMRALYDVEVYTTCALDYMTWENHYAPGTEVINGITVHRFPVEQPRDVQAFNKLSERVLGDPGHSDRDEVEWVDEQGPLCPSLLETLYREQGQFKAVIFMTYLYYLTARGLPMHFNNAYLIPTAHDEPPIYLRCYESVFAGAKGFIWNTEVERGFVQKRFPVIRSIPGIIAGVGVDVPSGALPDIPPELKDGPYIVYAGRIDESKGCGAMFRFFRYYKKTHGGDLKLVLLGKPVMPVPNAKDIVSLGFVSDEMKFAVMRSARALVLFSQFESLSMVVLESMAMGRPVLVNGRCAVLKGHCLRSNAGLYFENYPEFAGALDYLLTRETEYAVMCENGNKYVKENYRWDSIVERIGRLIG